MDSRSDGLLRRQLLTFASHPETKVEDLLRHVLDRALETSGADAGGALYVFDAAAGPGAAPRACVSTGVLSSRDPSPPPSVADVARTATPVRLTGTSLVPGAASSLWVPLLEGRRQVVAVLGLASSRPRPLADGTVARVAALGLSAVPAINRTVLRETLAGMGSGQQIVGTSEALQALESRLKQSASFGDGPVLINGERGSGKELAALAIHAWSRRRGGPFVPVLASALPESMVADELFGHERHSFTGAAAFRPGRFGAADRGSLFLDEVGDLPLAIQSTLMRVIDQRELPRIGRDLPLKIDVRVIAATNRDLSVAMAKGEFRRDLYDRLSVFGIKVPPLRERREDIPLLVSFLLRRHCGELDRRLWLQGDGVCGSCGAVGIGCATRDFLAALQEYSWPGNVRELENVVASMVANSPDDLLDVRHLPPHILRGVEPPGSAISVTEDEDLTLDRATRAHILRVLALTGNNQTRTAKLLGLPLSTMRNKMKRLGLPLPDPRRPARPPEGARR